MSDDADLIRAAEVVDAFARLSKTEPDLRRAAERMQACFNSRLAPSEPRNRRADGRSRRCRVWFCQRCQDNRSLELESELIDAAKRGLDDPRTKGFLAVTFAGTWAPLERVADELEIRVAAWQRLAQRGNVKWISDDFVRTFSFDVDLNADEVRTRVNVFLSLKHLNALSTTEDWSSEWKSLDGCEVDEVAHFRVYAAEKLRPEVRFDAAVGRIASTGVNPRQLVQTSGNNVYCDEGKLLSLIQALKHRKFLHSGGKLARVKVR